ncbi:hypothetical protein NECAME_10289 [Necator americanus]|uniref:Uncharacterized protein n=1 Tax=Necator americanus TaxID=51031 RepID=W2T963_NECAM|nr:hypothetical protein NECAME_10289 [Necator americanus]ETN78555.1 hypothetical protein NECAME_10289 [Necator americanus]
MTDYQDMIHPGETKAIDEDWDNESISSTETVEVPNCSESRLLQTPKVFPSFWYQDNKNQRLVHQEQTYHHKEVFVYDGDPDSVLLQGSSQTAFLVTAYADAQTGHIVVNASANERW